MSSERATVAIVEATEDGLKVTRTNATLTDAIKMVCALAPPQHSIESWVVSLRMADVITEAVSVIRACLAPCAFVTETALRGRAEVSSIMSFLRRAERWTVAAAISSPALLPAVASAAAMEGVFIGSATEPIGSFRPEDIIRNLRVADNILDVAYAPRISATLSNMPIAAKTRAEYAVLAGRWSFGPRRHLESAGMPIEEAAIGVSDFVRGLTGAAATAAGLWAFAAVTVSEGPMLRPVMLSKPVRTASDVQPGGRRAVPLSITSSTAVPSTIGTLALTHARVVVTAAAVQSMAKCRSSGMMRYRSPGVAVARETRLEILDARGARLAYVASKTRTDVDGAYVTRYDVLMSDPMSAATVSRSGDTAQIVRMRASLGESMVVLHFAGEAATVAVSMFPAANVLWFDDGWLIPICDYDGPVDMSSIRFPAEPAAPIAALEANYIAAAERLSFYVATKVDVVKAFASQCVSCGIVESSRRLVAALAAGAGKTTDLILADVLQTAADFTTEGLDLWLAAWLVARRAVFPTYGLEFVVSVPYNDRPISTAVQGLWRVASTAAYDDDYFDYEGAYAPTEDARADPGDWSIMDVEAPAGPSADVGDGGPTTMEDMMAGLEFDVDAEMFDELEAFSLADAYAMSIAEAMAVAEASGPSAAEIDRFGLSTATPAGAAVGRLAPAGIVSPSTKGMPLIAQMSGSAPKRARKEAVALSSWIAGWAATSAAARSGAIRTSAAAITASDMISCPAQPDRVLRWHITSASAQLASAVQATGLFGAVTKARADIRSRPGIVVAWAPVGVAGSCEVDYEKAVELGIISHDTRIVHAIEMAAAHRVRWQIPAMSGLLSQMPFAKV